MKIKRFTIDKKNRQDMAFLMYHNPDGMLAAVFASMPLSLKQHCIKVGAVAGIIAERTPGEAVPKGMMRMDYANAVRYGGFYHCLGCYLSYDRWDECPSMGRDILEKEINKDKVAGSIRRVILETVSCADERFNGEGSPNRLSGRQIPLHAGICAIADTVDHLVSRRRSPERAMRGAVKYIRDNEGVLFPPDAVAWFLKAERRICDMYWAWRERPPLWNYGDLKPDNRP